MRVVQLRSEREQLRRGGRRAGRARVELQERGARDRILHHTEGFVTASLHACVTVSTCTHRTTNAHRIARERNGRHAANFLPRNVAYDEDMCENIEQITIGANSRTNGYA